jgi:hypothetical protein
MWPFIVAIVAIVAWALTRIIQSGSQTGAEWVKAHGGEALEALQERMARLEDERQRLTQRVENLEAIVTSEHYDLDREAWQALAPTDSALPEASRPLLSLDEPDVPEDDEAQVARMARRVRGE